jgi:CheY-like chemotaxis protein
VLVAEDNERLAGMVASALALAGFEVVVAHDGYSALRLAVAKRFDALLTDLLMPGLSGDAVARRARRVHPELPGGADDRLPRPPIVSLEQSDPYRARPGAESRQFLTGPHPFFTDAPDAPPGAARGGWRRKGAEMKRDRITQRRHRLAGALEQAAVPERPFRHGIRYIVHPDISTACAPSLLTIAAVLRDETQRIDDGILHQVLSFITDGTSPFFGRDITDALQAAVRLQHRVLRGATRQLARGTPQRHHLRTPAPVTAHTPGRQRRGIVALRNNAAA